MSTENANKMRDALNRAYSERNRLAIGMAMAVVAAGGSAGWAVDPDWESKGWEFDWSVVVYIDLPSGEQISYHMAPEQAAQAQDLLPAYTGEWNGKFTGREADWPEKYHGNT